MNKNKLLNIFIGLLISGILFFVLPKDLFSIEAKLSLATIALMIFWWITRPVHIAVTAFLPVVVNSIYPMIPMGTVISKYATSITFLLIGTGILVACFKYWNLDKRIALKTLLVLGTSVKQHLLVWFLISTVFSMFLPNAIVAATLCPIAYSMIRYCSATYCKETNNLILLSIVWGAGLGGFGTPLGGAMNLVVIEHIEAFTGSEFMYITWSIKMLPYLALLVAGTCGYLMLIKLKTPHLPGSKKYFRDELNKLGKISKSEKISLLLFFVAVILSFSRPFFSDILPQFKPPYIFLLFGILAFFLNGNNSKKLISWDYAVKNINWSLIILFSGGIAMGALLISSSAANSIALAITNFEMTSMIFFLSIFILLGLFLSNASSNTAACSISIPLLIPIVISLGYGPLPFVFLIAAACNCAFILPTSIRAIPVGYDLDIKYMLKKGMMAILICFAILLIVGYTNFILL